MAKVKRQYDDEAFNSIVAAAVERGKVEFDLESPEAAKRFRYMFYSWRKMKQELKIATPADRLIVRVKDQRVTITANSIDAALRSSLIAAGIDIRSLGSAPLVQEPEPPEPVEEDGEPALSMSEIVANLFKEQK